MAKNVRKPGPASKKIGKLAPSGRNQGPLAPRPSHDRKKSGLPAQMSAKWAQKSGLRDPKTPQNVRKRAGLWADCQGSSCDALAVRSLSLSLTVRDTDLWSVHESPITLLLRIIGQSPYEACLEHVCKQLVTLREINNRLIADHQALRLENKNLNDMLLGDVS